MKNVALVTDQQIELWTHGAARVLKMPAGNGGPDISVPALGSGMYIGYLSKTLREYRDEIERLREWLLDMDYHDGCSQCRVNSDHERMALKGAPPRGRPGHDEWVAANPPSHR